MTRRFPESAPNIAALASAIADPTRVMICASLLDGRAWTLTELSRALSIPMSSLSEHASILIDHGVLTQRRAGRHRYVQIASTDIADWLEHTGALADGAMTAAPTMTAKTRNRQLIDARTCYRHIAGRFGTQLFSALTQREWIDESMNITDSGRAGLAEAFGLDAEPQASSARPLVRRCLDWTERRSHLGGQLGDDICRTFFDRGWIQRRPHSRALTITPDGRDRLDWVLTAYSDHL
ncbi:MULTISPECIES: ArsR/SmtB family transcription factor [unclassified Brevibacterium]|uniref:ArsR/SmtB family transcription factor n=1 Tax=unclassified Brevibacterium TaxID=2614124 RepID=UPI001092A939|nr:winged helix-turn-helix domain-containing protein [Brevibacterium sp. S22]TGD31097.1 ArsR family transcriptional regulator [Brevibacterium sp. S22]